MSTLRANQAPTSQLSTSRNGHGGGTLRQGSSGGDQFDFGDDDEVEDQLSHHLADSHISSTAEDDVGMLDSVVLPILASVRLYLSLNLLAGVEP